MGFPTLPGIQSAVAVDNGRMSESITIVGASARAAAQSALRAGLRPFAGDLFADADLAGACPTVQVPQYPDGLEGLLASAPAGGWMYTGALENHPDLVDRLAEMRPLWGNRGDVLRRVRASDGGLRGVH